jgi:small subunit ribosomal protein S8
MTMTDPVADMLTRIRNALRASHESVDIPGSKIKEDIAAILKSEGYIRNFKIISHQGYKVIRIFLKYDENGTPVIGGLKRVSRPGRRVYKGYNDIPRVLGGYGINIVSTSKGLLTDQQARKMRAGGEVICSLW